jgi:hypothetical protein
VLTLDGQQGLRPVSSCVCLSVPVLGQVPRADTAKNEPRKDTMDRNQGRLNPPNLLQPTRLRWSSTELSKLRHTCPMGTNWIARPCSLLL